MHTHTHILVKSFKYNVVERKSYIVSIKNSGMPFTVNECNALPFSFLNRSDSSEEAVSVGEYLSSLRLLNSNKLSGRNFTKNTVSMISLF